MMQRKNILVIGRDSSAAVAGSQLHTRIKTYAQYHQFTFLVMNVGVRQESSVDTARVVLAGGKSLPTAFFKTLWRGYTELKSGQYDLVTTQDVLYAGLVGYLLSRYFRLPLFVQMHGDYLDNERWFKSNVGRFNRAMNGVGIFILKRAHFVRAVSERLRTQLIASYGLKPERIISIPIGTDLGLFQQSDTATRRKSLLFAQRLLPEKCALLFTEVATTLMQKYSDVTTDIAGDGMLKDEMVDYFTKAGVVDRVTFHGAVPQSTLVSLYQQSYIYLHTADWEGWGMPMIEAMAAGTPVVTTDTGCAGEAIRHGETGLVTAVNDTQVLIHETEVLLTDEALWNRLSTQGSKEAVLWSFDSLARKNMEWYATEIKD
jgi:glycosyltransferase involved in cell wall biosynthesis